MDSHIYPILSREWNIGQTLKNRPYRMEKKLGEGGFSITYLAKNLRMYYSETLKDS